MEGDQTSWSRCYDDASGCFYWYNAATQQSYWDPDTNFEDGTSEDEHELKHSNLSYKSGNLSLEYSESEEDGHTADVENSPEAAAKNSMESPSLTQARKYSFDDCASLNQSPVHIQQIFEVHRAKQYNPYIHTSSNFDTTSSEEEESDTNQEIQRNTLDPTLP
eukprot:CAMPEP_0117772606 /NCGR_PEP_ID=MMETSP0947-20121206/25224_1 /TAXON_ID=44440 /ORGANISM="Chattonella subsalsa, Strain CCMP2191" /LENGTH=162 /DNA_ID=CAMNT_0005598317 /DNA_START=163 /DNA_END=647 /DNA_ORIENTATION=+